MMEFYLRDTPAKIFARYWPCDAPSAILLLVHGMGTHSGRCNNMAGYFNKNDIGVYSYDHPGHGQSEGKRGHVSSYEVLLDSLDVVVKYIKEKHPDVPVFLLGHSMGGNVVVNYAMRRKPDITGVILSSPWLKLAFSPPFFQMIFGRIILNIFPGFAQRSRLNVNYISHDAQVLKEYEADKMIHNFITPAFFFNIVKAGLWALQHAGEFNLPIYIYHGTEDHITSFSSAKEFASKIPQAIFREWGGCYHEVHNEWVRDELYASILDFIGKQLLLRETG